MGGDSESAASSFSCVHVAAIASGANRAVSSDQPDAKTRISPRRRPASGQDLFNQGVVSRNQGVRTAVRGTGSMGYRNSDLRPRQFTNTFTPMMWR